MAQVIANAGFRPGALCDLRFVERWVYDESESCMKRNTRGE